MTAPSRPSTRTASRADKLLRLFADVRPGEATTSLLLLANILLVLAAYYLVKPVREGWLAVSVIQGYSAIEVKAISALAQTVLLFAVLPAYSRLASSWSRRELVTRSGLFFGGLLIFFWLLRPGLVFSGVPYAGVAFYIFVGILNVTLVAQFWAFAADIYGQDRGVRLFPMIAIGAAGGAVIGSWLAQKLLGIGALGAYELIPLSLVPLAIAVLAARLVDARGAYGDPSPRTTVRWDQPAAPGNEGPFAPLFNHRYLAASALLILIFNWVLTSGDIVLFGLVQNLLASQAFGADAPNVLIDAATARFYGDLYFWINLIGLLLQAFVVSKLLRFGGFGLLILTTPVIAVTAYASMLIAPVLAVVKLVKIAEISSTISINNTARQMLWLPTTKSVLYQTKTAVDTLFVRLGDGLAAVTLLVGVRVLKLEPVVFLIVNVVLALVWVWLAWIVTREYRRLTDDDTANSPVTPVPSEERL